MTCFHDSGNSPLDSEIDSSLVRKGTSVFDVFIEKSSEEVFRVTVSVLGQYDDSNDICDDWYIKRRED